MYGDILYDVGKLLYKYCTSTFPISTLTIVFKCILCGGTYMSTTYRYVIVLWK